MDKCNVEGWQDMMKVAEKRVLVWVSTGGDLWQELAYYNHRIVRKYEGKVSRNTILDGRGPRGYVHGR